MSKNLKIQWRVEWRLSRKHKWRKAGLFETRAVARYESILLRRFGNFGAGFGFGNTRVTKYIKA